MPGACEIDGIVPVVDPEAFVHPDATLIGDVIIGPDCYVAPLASLRGDFGRIVVERGANGHGAVLHGCLIGRGVLVGMNSVVMDGAVIGERSFIGANSFVPGDFEVPPRHLAVGSPAAVTRELTEAELAWKANGTRVHQDLARRSRATLRPVRPLSAVEPDRGRVGSGSDQAVPLREYRRESP